MPAPADTCSYILSFQCPDRIGVVARSTGLLLEAGAFITEISNYSDPVSETFHLRCVFDDRQMTVPLEEFRRNFEGLAQEFEARWQLRSAVDLPRVLVAVSKYDHCLNVLLNKWRAGALPAAIVGVVSNHPDCRSMKSRGSGIVGYNVQTAVDTENHLIVSHEVINTGSDRDQLSNMAKQAQEVLEAEDLKAVADRGYFKGEEILACDQAGIQVTLPKPQTSSAQAGGRFGKRDFHYVSEDDEYRCPAGERLIWRMTTQEKGQTLHRYWSSSCPHCSMKYQCTPSPYRRITRWEHEEVLEAVQERLDQDPDAMRLRRQTAEHPFGTLKLWMGYTHFLTWTLPKVRTEMSLQVLSYNLKRVINLLGVGVLLEAMQA